MKSHTYNLPYGTGNLQFNLGNMSEPDLYLPIELHPNLDQSLIVYNAIRNPLNNFICTKITNNNISVVITINDKTRPVPNNLLFPPLLEYLLELGIQKEMVTIIIATGTHVPMPENEFSMLLSPDILREYKVISHNCDDESNLCYKGTTSRGTPVLVNKIYDQADLKIVVGDIEPHHFAGFSGGYKSASIGLTGRSTINHNHALLQDPKSSVGRFEDNPLRQDIEEIGLLIGVDLALNAVLNENKEILHVFFGKPQEVIQEGIKVIRETELTVVKEPYDLVIASAGGYPKDINLYQAQKALTHASLFCKNGGTVLLAAACNEGVGSQSYEDFMKGISSFEEARVKLFKEGFRVGPHKSFQFGLIANRINFHIKTEIDDQIMEKLLLSKIIDLQKSINHAIYGCASQPRIAILPYATATIPQLNKG